MNAFPRAIQGEEAAGGAEALWLGAVSSTIIPGSVQRKRFKRIARQYSAGDDREVLPGPFDEMLTTLGDRRLSFRDRVRRAPVYHIACREAIERMAQGGWCPVEHALHQFGPPACLTADEGQESIEEVIALLTDCSNYSLGLTDREEGGPLVAVWKVVGTRTVLLETWRDGEDRDEVDVVIRQEAIAGAFRDHFRRRWRALPAEGRDRRQVIRWLKGRLKGA